MSDYELQEAAQRILSGNWTTVSSKEGFTKPTNGLYPFQWSWDSAFHAMGYARTDVTKAQTELRTLFAGQWSNGLLPHIVFHNADSDEAQGYFPGPDVWRSSVSSVAPDTLPTSGLVQPPVHAYAVWQVFATMRDEGERKAKNWLREMYPKLLHFHRYLHTARDPESTGLITIYHPWESGLDNSPRWDESLEKVEKADMSAYVRRDTQHVDKKQRPSDDAYARYMSLVHSLRDARYDDERISRQHAFRVKDIFLSSLLYRSNGYLLQMATALGKATDEIESWLDAYETGLEELCWDEEDGLYYDYDLIAEKRVRCKTIASLMPLMSVGIGVARRESLITHLESRDFCGEGNCSYGLKPSVSLSDESYSPKLYWRGPVWVNANWLLSLALYEQGHMDYAMALCEELIQMVKREGFYEYYATDTGEGLGGKNFSWSAALVLDILERRQLRLSSALDKLLKPEAAAADVGV